MSKEQKLSWRERMSKRLEASIEKSKEKEQKRKENLAKSKENLAKSKENLAKSKENLAKSKENLAKNTKDLVKLSKKLGKEYIDSHKRLSPKRRMWALFTLLLSIFFATMLIRSCM